MRKKSKDKTPIICAVCFKQSGYFQEDFVYDKVEKPKYCKKCGSIVLDKPDFIKPNYN